MCTWCCDLPTRGLRMSAMTLSTPYVTKSLLETMELRDCPFYVFLEVHRTSCSSTRPNSFLILLRMPINLAYRIWTSLALSGTSEGCKHRHQHFPSDLKKSFSETDKSLIFCFKRTFMYVFGLKTEWESAQI